MGYIGVFQVDKAEHRNKTFVGILKERSQNTFMGGNLCLFDTCPHQG